MVRLNSPLAETPNAKDYIDVMCEIRKLALFNSEFEENTPTIVVFGDQSSGKSSVLQRLTGGLPMPRGSTKCAATPSENLMLQTSEPLRSISLRYIEDKNRKPISPREVDFADITDIDDEEEIEEKLREAQRYVQNPSIVDVDNTQLPPDTDECRTEIEEKLKRLPIPSDGNPTIRFLELIGSFDKDFTSHANAEHVEHRLYRGQLWNFGQFDSALLGTRPRFRLSLGEELLNDVFDPIKPGALQVRGWPLSMKEEILADTWGETEEDPDYTWELEQLSETVQKSQGGQLVGYFPYKAVVAIVAKHQKDWFRISTKLLETNHDWVNYFTNEMVENTFKEFPNAIDEIKRVLRNLLKACKEETFKRLKDIEDMEHMSSSRALYVTDEASILKKQSKYFIKYRILSAASKQESSELQEIISYGTKLFDMMYDEDADEDEFERMKDNLINAISVRELNDISQKLIEEIRSYKIISDMPSTATMSMMLAIKNSYLDKLIGVTPKNEDHVNRTVLTHTINEQAFLAATGALAYWKMSHTKFREIVPRAVEFYLVHQFAINLGMHLRTHFNLLGTPQNKETNALDLRDILGEDPENAKNRKEWQEKIDNLSAVLEKVRKVSIRNHSRGSK